MTPLQQKLLDKLNARIERNGMRFASDIGVSLSGHEIVAGRKLAELGLARYALDPEHMPEGTEWDCLETFEDADVLTRDRGLLLTLANGHEYQITIKRSR